MFIQNHPIGKGRMISQKSWVTLTLRVNTIVLKPKQFFYYVLKIYAKNGGPVFQLWKYKNT